MLNVKRCCPFSEINNSNISKRHCAEGATPGRQPCGESASDRSLSVENMQWEPQISIEQSNQGYHRCAKSTEYVTTDCRVHPSQQAPLLHNSEVPPCQQPLPSDSSEQNKCVRCLAGEPGHFGHIGR